MRAGAEGPWYNLSLFIIRCEDVICRPSSDYPSPLFRAKLNLATNQHVGGFAFFTFLLFYFDTFL
jgi:hypothetical protein